MACAGTDRLKRILGSSHRVQEIREPSDAQSRLEVFDSADVIVGGPLTTEIVQRAKLLKLFHVFRGGIDGLGVELLSQDVAVANTFHHEIGVAEFAVMACLVLPRQIFEHDAMLRRGDWSGSVMWGEPPEYSTLSESTVLVVGAGHIGCNVISRLAAFGPEIIAVSRDPARSIDGVNAVVGYEVFYEYLGRADFVILTVRLADNTAGLIGTAELSSMKSTAYLVNLARGGVVDQHALYRALKAREIAGAAIDVWYNYPTTRDETCLPSDSPLYELDNVLLSPNRSSWSNRMLDGRIGDVAENVTRLASGSSLINVVHSGRYGAGS
jgi:phosphoglycerate dehydrogenase-like enzyme